MPIQLTSLCVLSYFPAILNSSNISWGCKSPGGVVQHPPPPPLSAPLPQVSLKRNTAT